MKPYPNLSLGGRSTHQLFLGWTPLKYSPAPFDRFLWLQVSPSLLDQVSTDGLQTARWLIEKSASVAFPLHPPPPAPHHHLQPKTNRPHPVPHCAGRWFSLSKRGAFAHLVRSLWPSLTGERTQSFPSVTASAHPVSR